MKLITVATLKMVRPNDFTKSGVKDVAAWLRHQADMLEQSHKDYDDQFKATYALYESKKKDN